jgi:PKD repeat protein
VHEEGKRASSGALLGGVAASRRHRQRGQSLVEFALVVPLLLLVLLVGIDFGRVYLGWINLQNMARIAANYAANNATAAWGNAADPTVVAYRNQITADSSASNCTVWNPTTKAAIPPPLPAFSDTNGDGTSTGIGDDASIAINCRFDVFTPVISSIVGGSVNVAASATYPVKTGLTATASTGGGGGGGGIAPSAAFSATPTNVALGAPVQFNDESGGGAPTSWLWDFGDGTTDTARDPVHSYSTVGYKTITLTATNATGSSTVTKSNYIAVSTPSGAAFSGSPTAITSGKTVSFTDESTGTPTSWLWDFGDGSTSTQQNPSHAYTSATARTYDVTLTVTNALGSSTLKKTAYVSLTIALCTVPDFANTSSSSAQSTWVAAGFTTTVDFKQGNLPWLIKSQTIVGNSTVACAGTIHVSKN